MSSNYILADVLSSIKNFRSSGYSRSSVNLPYNKLSLSVLQQAKKYGYIDSVEKVEMDKKLYLSVGVKFDAKKKNVIRSIKFFSTPGRRSYMNVDELKHLQMKNSYSLLIISTSSGVFSSKDAIKNGVGGEVLCEIF